MSGRSLNEASVLKDTNEWTSIDEYVKNDTVGCCELEELSVQCGRKSIDIHRESMFVSDSLLLLSPDWDRAAGPT